MKVKYYIISSVLAFFVSNVFAGVVALRDEECDPRGVSALSPIIINTGKAIVRHGYKVVFNFKTIPASVDACKPRDQFTGEGVECIQWSFPLPSDGKKFDAKKANTIEVKTKNHKWHYITNVRLYMPGLHVVKGEPSPPMSLVYSIASEGSNNRGRVEVPIYSKDDGSENYVMQYIYNSYMKDDKQNLKLIMDLFKNFKKQHIQGLPAVYNVLLDYLRPSDENQGWYEYKGSDICHPEQPVKWFVAKNGIYISSQLMNEYRDIFTGNDSTKDLQRYRELQSNNNAVIHYYNYEND